MAFLEANPKTIIQPTRVEHRDHWVSGAQTREVQAKRLEWPIDDTGGETDHRATYEVDNWQLVRFGPQLGRTDETGIWFEEYEIQGAWS